jgi:hypothetical protein
MGLEHLEGRRTGRPRGAKTTPRVKRDILWAYRHLDDPDAKPPSPGAKRWAEYARRQPDKFLDRVLRASMWEEKPRGSTGRKADDSRWGERPSRVMMMHVPWAHLLEHFTGKRGGIWLRNLPPDTRLVACAKHPGPVGSGVDFLIRSETFPEVAEGEPIPEFPWKYVFTVE